MRHSLINQNQMGKYFKYAIGEIILVVIGILIALQINNWNENQKSHVREQTYLESLLDDMENNLVEIHDDITSNERVIKACDSLLLLANLGNYTTLEDDTMEALVISLGNYSKLQLEQGTIEEIMSSGSLQTIRNKDLRGYLVDWNRNFIEIKEMEIFARQFQEKYLSILDTFLPYYKFEYVDVKYTDSVRETYFNHLELLNTIGNIRFVAHRLNENYKEKVTEIEILIEKLESELQ